MKYVKRISLFFVYPACCFILGIMAGSIVWDDGGLGVFVNESEVQKDDALNVNVDEEVHKVVRQENHLQEKMEQGQYVMNPNALQEMTETEQVVSEAGYFITIKDDYVVVYHGDRETVFLSTDIRAEELPEDVQMDLKEWMYMADEGVLYDFLENYTS